MSPARRLAAATLAAVMSLGFVAISSSPAAADYSWGGKPRVVIR